MWLLHTTNYMLKEHVGNPLDPRSIFPEYAILSHVWSSAGEITFKDLSLSSESREPQQPGVHDIANPENYDTLADAQADSHTNSHHPRLQHLKQKAGWQKVEMACEKAWKADLQWIWIDSCCIDKRSSAELSENINSMWTWYSCASVGYAWLEDVDFGNHHEQLPVPNAERWSEAERKAVLESRWFSRGWTLQELLATRKLRFYDRRWRMLGGKEKKGSQAFMELLVQASKVKMEVLRDPSKVSECSVAERMSWQSERAVTRPEDIAYSLLGIFDVHMYVIYGEGRVKAFTRLQLQILNSSTDQSLFAWRNPNRESSGLLAQGPEDFKRSGDYVPWAPSGFGVVTLKPFSMTNLGCDINLPIIPARRNGLFMAGLRCWTVDEKRSGRVRILLRKIKRPGATAESAQHLYRRVFCGQTFYAKETDLLGQRTDLFVLEDEHYRYLRRGDDDNNEEMTESIN